MSNIKLRKTIGICVVLAFYLILVIGEFIPFLGNIIGDVIMFYLLLPSIGLLIMGPTVDGKPGLIRTIFGLSVKIGKWGWLLVPIFPADIILGLIFILVGISICFFGLTLFAIVPAAIDYIQTIIVLRKENN